MRGRTNSKLTNDGFDNNLPDQTVLGHMIPVIRVPDVKFPCLKLPNKSFRDFELPNRK